MTELKAYFDGACEYWKDPKTGQGRRNPGGLATYGWIIYEGERQIAYGLGEACRGEGATNNVAEYQALIGLLQAIIDLGLSDRTVTVIGDSKLVVYQVKGDWAVRSSNVRPHYETAVAVAQGVVDLCYKWVPREQNAEADDLSKKAYHISLTKAEPYVAWTHRAKTNT